MHSGYNLTLNPLPCFSFCPTDKKFVTCSDDSLVKIWDFHSCTEERAMRGHGAEVKCCDWHPQKGLIVSGSKDTQQPIKLWDPRVGQSLTTLYVTFGFEIIWMVDFYGNPDCGNIVNIFCSLAVELLISTVCLRFTNRVSVIPTEITVFKVNVTPSFLKFDLILSCHLNFLFVSALLVLSYRITRIICFHYSTNFDRF